MKMSVGNHCLRPGQTFSGKAHVVHVSDSWLYGSCSSLPLEQKNTDSAHVNELHCCISIHFIYKNWQWAPACWPLLVLEEYYLWWTRISPFGSLERHCISIERVSCHQGHVHSLGTWTPTPNQCDLLALFCFGPFYMGQDTLLPVISLLGEVVRAAFSWKRNLGAFHLEFVSVIFIFLVSCSPKSLQRMRQKLRDTHINMHSSLRTRGCVRTFFWQNALNSVCMLSWLGEMLLMSIAVSLFVDK